MESVQTMQTAVGYILDKNAIDQDWLPKKPTGNLNHYLRSVTLRPICHVAVFSSYRTPHNNIL